MLRLARLLVSITLLTPAAAFSQTRPIVLKTSLLLDGKGQTLTNTIILIEGSKIARIGRVAPSGAITYDLTGFTVLQAGSTPTPISCGISAMAA